MTHKLWAIIELLKGTIDRKTSGHGILFLNSNAMDITLQPGAGFDHGKATWRTTGGIFDFLVMLGPTPKEITSQSGVAYLRPKAVMAISCF